jgi:predicted protein tyrosine phosphatase
MIVVCGLHAAQVQIDLHGAQSVIGILGPETRHPEFTGVNHHLRLNFNDVNAETHGLISPQPSDAEKLVHFISTWDQTAPLLIHCWMGISRSTASAFAALCILRPEVDEMILAKELRDASPSATPNRLITAQVDELLGREGRMQRAVESIGRGADAYEGKPFVLKV